MSRTRIHRASMFGEWQVYDDAQLAHLRSIGQDRFVDAFLERETWGTVNGLATFQPHGLARSDVAREYAGGRIIIPPSQYSDRWKNDGAAFLMDYVNDYVFLLAPRKTGKTYHGAAAIGLRVCKTDPSWPIFTEAGLEWREFTGPKVAVIGSFSWPNVIEAWKVYQEVLPEDELGPYSRHGKRTLSFGDGRPKSITLKRSGSTLIFLCYVQLQHIWENFKSHYLHADEQIPLEKLSAWEDGTRTMGGGCQVFFTLSGFTLPNRPDTGEAGELKRGIYDGTRTRGKTVGRYNFDIPSTPDAVIDAGTKKQIYDQYANPKVERSAKDERRALAVYYPGWETRGSMVFDADTWDRSVHVIEPLWKDGETPTGVTKWRSIDYGARTGINVCSWWAVGPLAKMRAGRADLLERVRTEDRGMVVAVLYRLLYESGLEIVDLVREVIARSGNRQELIGEERDESTGNTYQMHREVQDKEQFWGGTLLDGRSCSQSQQGQTLEQIFYRYGLQDVRPACGQKDVIQYPRLKDMLKIDWTQPHPFTGKPGRAMLYFFDGRCAMAVREIEGIRTPEDMVGTSLIN
ncbi:MAG: hypothetical protein ACOYMV_13100, partial [Verrucomicrobiia bacterium]